MKGYDWCVQLIMLLQLVAEIMGQPERGHWKNCLVSEQEEKRLAEQFRDNFTPFDFTQ